MSDCFDSYGVAGCHTAADGSLVPVVLHYVNDNVGAPAVVITDVAGAVVALADESNTVAGACPLPLPDVEWQQLCDVQADGSVVPFMCQVITTFAADGTPTNASANFELDKETPYTVTGTVAECPQCEPLADGERGIQPAWRTGGGK